MLKDFNDFINENLSIDLESMGSDLRFANTASKNTMNIKKNTNYLKNGRAINSVVTVTTQGKQYNYQVYIMGKPFNLKSLEPTANDSVKITYYTGEMAKSNSKKYETKTVVKSLDMLKDYVDDLKKGVNIDPLLVPFKLIRV
jgi:hypothetical protein